MDTKSPAKQAPLAPLLGNVENDGAPIQKLGARLRALRIARGWTLNELALKSKVSRSALSKVERDEVSPTYDVIQRLARGLDLDIGEFFGTEAVRPRPEGRRAVSRASQDSTLQGRGYLYRLICAELSTKKMLPFRATILARTLAEAGGLTAHSGEECLYVLKGSVEFHTEHYAPTVLNEGDAIYIDSTMAHACVSVGDDAAEVFWINVT